MNNEEDEFRRIEREALRRAAFQRKVDDAMRIAFEAKWDKLDDDDTQVYAKPWVGLTIEEIGDIFNNTPNPTEKVGPFVIRFSRAIEAKLKEKNT
jgi:hypothetical protein